MFQLAKATQLSILRPPLYIKNQDKFPENKLEGSKVNGLPPPAAKAQEHVLIVLTPNSLKSQSFQFLLNP